MNQVHIPSGRIDEVGNDNCSNNFVRQIPSIQIFDKQWAVVNQQREKPQDEFARLGRRIGLFKINQKSNPEEQLYKVIRRKYSLWFESRHISLNQVHISIAERLKLHGLDQILIPSQHAVDIDDLKVLELMEENKKTQTEVVDERQGIPSMITKQVEGLFTNVARILRIKKTTESLKLHNPYQKFMPSQHLVCLVRIHMMHPDEEELKLMKEIKKIQTEVVDERQNISSMITKQVEGLFTNVAKRIFRIKKHVRITKDKRFTPEICSDLIDRLGLDVYNSRLVLELLYHELYKFVSSSPRERSWGRIIAENSEIKLNVRENAFKFPELSKIDNK